MSWMHKILALDATHEAGRESVQDVMISDGILDTNTGKREKEPRNAPKPYNREKFYEWSLIDFVH